LTMALITATILESVYDTPTSQYFVYQSIYFYILLSAFGVVILFVALSRIPWQKKHAAFLTAHLGILILLYGSFLTFKLGVDGQLRVDENTREAVVELNEPLLLVAGDEGVRSTPIEWQPPFVDFSPMNFPEHGFTIDRFMTHADPQIHFVKAASERPMTGALKMKLFGGPTAPPFMRRGQEFWIWAKDPNWYGTQVGPAVISWASELNFKGKLERGPIVQFLAEGVKPGEFKWRAMGGDQVQKSGTVKIDQSGKLEKPIEIDLGWKFEAKLQILEAYSSADSKVDYEPSTIQFGPSAPPSAIHLIAEGAQEGIWLGLGERAELETRGKKVQIGYFPRRITLPFAIELQKFQIDYYQGTRNPASFASLINVLDPKSKEAPQNLWIRMNEPLKYKGYTIYQASFENDPATNQPVASVFSVNQDPGRPVKYFGSLIIVMGILLLFYFKRKVKKGNTV
ncbi:MAG: hypothetical protein EOP09_12605, partial [Proteobacteria bacterium]